MKGLKANLYATASIAVAISSLGAGEQIYKCITFGGMLACAVLGIMLLGVAVCLAGLAVSADNDAREREWLRKVHRNHSNSWRDAQ